MDFNQIQEIIRMVSKHKLSEFSLKQGDFKLTVRNQANAAEGAVPVVMASSQPVLTVPAAAAPPPAPSVATQTKAEAATATAASEDDKLLAIKSPMVGTFYRSAGPDKPPIVKIGDTVDIGSKVCIIEAMKLFNEIDSEVKGRIVKILVEDASPVEYDQPLFMVEAL